MSSEYIILKIFTLKTPISTTQSIQIGIAQNTNWEDVELRRSSGSGIGQTTGFSGSSSAQIGSTSTGSGGGVPSEGRLSSGSVHHNPTPPAQRRLAKSFSVASSQSKG